MHDVIEAVAMGILPQGIVVQEVPPLAALEAIIQMRGDQDLIEQLDGDSQAVGEAGAECVQGIWVPGTAWYEKSTVC